MSTLGFKAVESSPSQLVRLLSKYCFDDAERYYQTKRWLIGREYYESQVQKYRDEEEWDQKAEECWSQFSPLLLAYKFDVADKFYEDNQQYIDKEWYDFSTQKYKAEYKQKIRDCQSQLVDLLSIYKFKVADDYYGNNQQYTEPPQAVPVYFHHPNRFAASSASP